MLGLISIGFLGYALWRGVQAVADPDREGTDVRALGKRVGYGASALIYAGLAFSTLGLVFGSASEGGGTPDDWTAAYGLFMLSMARYRHINTGRVQ